MSAAAWTDGEMFTGIYPNVSMDDYRKLPAVSASDLKNMGRSPAYAHMKHRSSSPSTKAQQWGTDVHTAILEPHTLGTRYALDPESPKGGYPAGWRNTKDYKEQKAKLFSGLGFEGVLTANELQNLEWIQKRVRENKFGASLYELDGIREASVLAYDEEFGLWRKCRPDWYTPTACMATDLKKVKDHRPWAFAKACHEYGYHISAAYYIDTMTMAGCDVEHHPFLTINGVAPFEVAAYTLDEDSIEQGRHDYREHLAEWRDCVELQRWPGGSEEIEELRLPGYAITYHEEARTL